MLIKEELLYLVLLLLALGEIILFIYILRLKKKIEFFFREGDKDFLNLIKSKIKAIDLHQNEIKTVSQNLDKIENTFQKTLQKVGLIRYNPFQELGGDQSFSLAVLDKNNDGFIITSHYNQQFNRIYIKQIFKGKSNRSLSKEEQEAIRKAIDENYGTKNKK